MKYLKSRTGQLKLALFAIVAVTFVLLPSIDLRFSALFFRDGAFPFAATALHRVLHAGLGYVVAATLLATAAVVARNRYGRRAGNGLCIKSITVLGLVVVFGAGLMVNVLLKDQFGRARPRDVVEFGGTKHFTPAFVPSDQCVRNCSFSSGEGAAGFFFLAVARVVSRRRRVFAAAAVFGTLISLSRIAAGAHFLSDVVTSFFIMWIVTDVAYCYLYRYRKKTWLPRACVRRPPSPPDGGAG